MNNVRVTVGGRMVDESYLDTRFSSFDEVPWVQVCGRGRYQLVRIAVEAVVVAALCVGWWLSPDTMGKPASIGLVVVGMELTALALATGLPGIVSDVTVSKKGVRGDQGGVVPWSDIAHLEVEPQTRSSFNPIAWFLEKPGRFTSLKITRADGTVSLCQMRNTRCSTDTCTHLKGYIEAVRGLLPSLQEKSS